MSKKMVWLLIGFLGLFWTTGMGKTPIKSSLIIVDSIRVTSPNGGEEWTASSTQPITWTSSGSVGNILIEYSLNAGGSWTIITKSTENDGSFTWTLPGTLSNKCLVRVSDSDGDDGPSDVSDSFFAIAAQNTDGITVLAPNGGEKLVPGNLYDIKWNCGDSEQIDDVTIEYSTDRGNTWDTIAIAAPARNEGIYRWTVANTPSDDCLVRVRGTSGDAAPGDESDSTFTIIPSNTPTIRVNSPNGGEIFWIGNTYALTWTGSPTPDYVKIEFSTNGGESWKEIISSAPGGTSFDWTVPDNPSDNCLIRVSDHANGTPWDTSDNVFEIATPPSMVLISPNGGEQLEPGQNHSINWESQYLLEQITLELSIDKGRNWKEITQNVPDGNKYDWTVPNTPSDNCLIRVNGIDASSGEKVSDQSDEIFTIIDTDKPSLTVVSPNGGEGIYTSSSYDITWSSTGAIGAVKIDFSSNGGESWEEIIASAENDGTHQWQVPDKTTDLALIRISEAGGDVVDVSDAVFSLITPPSQLLILTSPNGGESLPAGSIHDITWNSEAIELIVLGYSFDGGKTWLTIASMAANERKYTWTVPDTPSDKCLVRIVGADGYTEPSPSDISDDTFTILSPAAAAIRLYSPNGGETLKGGTTHTIKWSSQGDISIVHIEYTKDEGKTWSTIVSETTNDGGYDWPVPDAQSSLCLVRVTALNGSGDPRPSDWSDQVFTITPPPVPLLKVLTPNGGEQLIAGKVYPVTWSSANIRTNINIEYSINGGDYWEKIIFSTQNDGTYAWTVPNTPSEFCLVRISESDDSAVDISDATFSIIPPLPAAVTVITPNGGENLEAGSLFHITWESNDLNQLVIQYSTNNGGTWMTIAAISADNNYYQWTVPGKSSHTCLIRISGIDNDTIIADVSDATFSINNPEAASLILTSPVGGEVLSGGSKQEITWLSNGVEMVLLEYSSDDRSSWHVIESVSAGQGSYTWSVPSIASNTCRVRISETITGLPFDISAELFTITLRAQTQTESQKNKTGTTGKKKRKK